MEAKIKTAKQSIETILGKISNDYQIPLPDLLKYLEAEPELNTVTFLKKTGTSCICKARKQDGQRCTRRCKDSSEFCGKHINKQKFGCVQETTPNDIINTDEYYYNDIKYLVDEDQIVYQQVGDGYEIVGKRSKTGKISFLKDLFENKIPKSHANPTPPINLQIMFENKSPSVVQSMA